MSEVMFLVATNANPIMGRRRAVLGSPIRYRTSEGFLDYLIALADVSSLPV
jgi:hypothetical protein